MVGSAVTKKTPERSRQGSKIFRAVFEVELEQALHGLGAQGFEAIASSTLLKALKEGADLHARPLKGGLGKLAVLPKVLQVRLQKPAVRLLDRSRLDRLAHPDLSKVGEQPLKGCPDRGSGRVRAGAQVLDVSLAEGIDERLGKALTSRQALIDEERIKLAAPAQYG